LQAFSFKLPKFGIIISGELPYFRGNNGHRIIYREMKRFFKIKNLMKNRSYAEVCNNYLHGIFKINKMTRLFKVLKNRVVLFFGRLSKINPMT